MIRTTSGIEQSSLRLSADGLVMAEAAFPHEVRPSPRKQQPAGLDCHRLNKLCSFESAEKDRDWTKQFIIKRQPFHHRLYRSWHDVDGKHLAAEEILERINDEHDGRDFQNPKCPHRQAIGDEELNKRGHNNRDSR